MSTLSPSGEKPPNVLLGEDDTITRLTTTKLLEQLGCQVEAVATGVAVIEAVRSKTYDLLFLDCLLPDRNGLEVAQAIRALGHAGSRLPIVAVTASGSLMTRERCLAAGMSDWMPKPSPIASYVEMLKRWIPSY